MTDQVGIGFDSSDIITGVNQGLSSLDSLVRKFVQIDATMVSSNNAVKGRLSELQRALKSSTQGVLGVMAETQRNAYESMLGKARDNDTQQLNLIKRQSMGMQQLYENRLLSEQALNNKELEIWKAHGVALGGIQQAQLKGFSLNSLMAATQQGAALDRLSGGLSSSFAKLKDSFSRAGLFEFESISQSFTKLHNIVADADISRQLTDISFRNKSAAKLAATEIAQALRAIDTAKSEHLFGGKPEDNSELTLAPLKNYANRIKFAGVATVAALEGHAEAVRLAQLKLEEVYLKGDNWQLSSRSTKLGGTGTQIGKLQLSAMATYYQEEEALAAANLAAGEQNFARIMALDDAKAAERSKYISILQAAAAKEEKVRLDLLEATKLIAADEAALEAKRVARFAVNTSMAQGGNSRIAATRESEVLRAATVAETEAMRLMSLEGANLNAVVRGLAQGFGFISSGLVTMLPLMAGFALAATAVSTWKAGAEFERSMFVISELAGASEKDIVGLSKALLDLGANSQYGPLEAAKGLETLSLAGLKAKDAIAALRPTLNFASAGDVTMEAAAATLVSVATAYRYSATSFELVGDIIAKTAADTMSSVTNMSEAFKTSSVLAQQYKVSLTDTAAALGMLAQIGITGSAAGTAYRNMLTEFNKGSGRAAEGIKMLGVEIHNADGSAKDLMTVMSSLSGGLLKLNAASQLKVLQDITNERGAKATAAFQAEFLSLINKTNPLLQEQADYYFKIGDKVKANNLLQEASLATYEKIRQKMADSADASAGFSSFANLEKEFTAIKLREGLAASIETDFVKAFAAVEKQALTLILTLREVVNSQGFQEGLTTFVSTVVSAATTIADVVIGIGKALAFVSDNVATSLAVAVAAIAAYTFAGAAGMAAVAAATAIATAVMGTASVVAGAATTTAGGLAVALGAQTASTGAASAGMALLITGEVAATVATETLTVATMSLSTALAFTPAGILLIGAALVATAVVAVDLKVKNDELADSEEAAARRGVKAAGELAEAHIDASRKIVEAQSKRLQETISTNEAEIALYKENEIKEGLIQNLQRAAFEAGKVKDFETEKTYNTRALELRAELFSKDQIAEKAQGLASIARIEQLGKEREEIIALAGEVGLLHRLYISLNPFSGGQESIDTIRQETAAKIAAAKASTAAQVAAAKAQLDTASRTFKELKDLRQKASDNEKRGLHGEESTPSRAKPDFTRLEKFKETASVELAERVKQAAIEQDLLKTQLANEQSLLKTAYDAKLINAGEYAARDLDLTLQAESRSVRAVVAARDAEEVMYVKQLAAKLAQREKFLAGNKPSTKGYAEGLTSLNTELANLGLQYETINKKSIADQMKLEEAATLRFSIAMAKLAGEVKATEKASDDFWKREAFNRAQSKASADLEESLRYATPEFAARVRAAAAETARFADLQYASNQTLLVAESEYAAQLALTNYVELESVALLEAKRKAVDALRAAQERLKTGGTESAEAAGVAARVKLERDNLGKLVTDIATAIETGLYEGGEKGAEALRNLIIAELKKPITIFVRAVVGDIAGSFSDSSAIGSGASEFMSGVGFVSKLSSMYDAVSAKLSVSGSAGYLNFANSSYGSTLGLSAGQTGYASVYDVAYKDAITAGLGEQEAVNAGLKAQAENLTSFGKGVGMAGDALAGYGLQKMISGNYTIAGGKTMDVITVAMSAWMGPIAGVVGGLINRAFGMGPLELVSAGTRGTFSNAGFSGENYQNYHRGGGWFRSDENTTDISGIDPKVAKAWHEAFIGLKAGMADAVQSLGLSAEGFKNYSKYVDIAAGSGAAGLTAAFTNMADEMVQPLLGTFKEVVTEVQGFFIVSLNEANDIVFSGTKKIVTKIWTAGEFVKEGESASAAITRLSTSLLTVNGWFSYLGNTLQAVSLKGADAASKLIDTFGGLDKYTEASKTYYTTYYSEEERAKRSMMDMAKALALVNLQLPTTKEGFKALVSEASKHLDTDTGRKAYALLLTIAPEFAAAADALSNVAKALIDTLTKAANSAMSTLSRAIAAQKAALTATYDTKLAAYNLQLDSVNTSVSKLQTLATSLKSTLSNMTIVGSEGARRAGGQLAISGALATAQAGGNLPLDGQLTDALAAVAQPSDMLFGSFVDYARDFYRTAIDISDLSDIAGLQLTDAQKLQALIKDQITVLTAGYKAETDKLDGILADNQKMLNAALGIDDSVISVADAVKQVNSSIQTLINAQALVNDAARMESIRTYIKSVYDTTSATTEAESLAKISSTAKDYGVTMSDVARSMGFSLESVQALYKKFGVEWKSTLGTEWLAQKAPTAVSKPDTGVPTSSPVTVGGGGAPSTASTAKYKQQYKLPYAIVSYDVVDPAAIARYDSIATAIEDIGVGSPEAVQRLASEAQKYGVSMFDLATASGYLYNDVKSMFAANGIPAFAKGINNVPFDMLANIHAGERIMPAADNARLFSVLDHADGTSDDIKALHEEVAGLRADMAKALAVIAESSKAAADILDKVTAGGDTMQIETM